MKKIIYSLVIMIAAGCLFTSCVENKVDEGRQELLKAKASYLDALSNLRAADAEKVKAEAALVQAQAATEQANAALKQALAEAEKIANEAKQAQTDEAVAQAKANIENIKAQAEIKAAQNAEALAKAQADLATALRNIEAAAAGLNDAEKKAISDAANYYNYRLGEYQTAATNYQNAQKALWSLEYDHAAGYETIGETAAQTVRVKNYEDSIALRKEFIAVNEKAVELISQAATNLEAVKAGIKAINDSIHTLAVDTANAKAALVLTKAIEMDEAAPRYEFRVKKFVHDSIVDVPGAFYFGDYDKDGNKVARYYAVNDEVGYNVYDLFAIDFVNYAAPLAKFNQDASVTSVADGTRGFWFHKDNKQNDVVNILEGNKDTLGLNGIVSALKRDLVIVADSTYAKGAEAQKARAEKFKAVYDSVRPLIEAGFTKDYKPAADSAAKLAAAEVADTIAAKALAAAAKVAHDDSVATIGVMKDAAKKYVTALEAFTKAYNDIVTGGFATKSESDTLEFVAAAKALGVAKAEYIGIEDTLKLWKIDGEQLKLTDCIPFSQLKKEGFVQKTSTDYPSCVTTLYGGQGYGNFANNKVVDKGIRDKAWYEYTGATAGDPFVKVANLAAGSKIDATGAISSSPHFFAAQVAAKQFTHAPSAYAKTEPLAFSLAGYTDTLAWYPLMIADAGNAAGKKPTAIAAAYDSTAAAVKILANAKTAKANTAAKVAAAEQGVKNAANVYVDMAMKFYGYKSANMTATDTANVLKGGKLPYSVSTFIEPFNCVNFSLSTLFGGPGVIPTIVMNPTLQVIMDKIGDTEKPRVFFNDTLTLFAKVFAEKQKYEAMASMKSLDVQLAEIEEIVKTINADYAEAAAAAEDAKAIQKANIAKLTGKEGGLVEFNLRDGLVDVQTGTWALAGYQKEWADELAPTYPQVYSEYVKLKLKNDIKINYLKNVAAKVEEVVVEAAKVETPAAAGATTIKDLETKIANGIAYHKGQIEKLTKEIAIFQKAIDQVKAGLDQYTINHQVAEASLQVAKDALAAAEKLLAAAKADYEAIIAKYTTK